MSRSVHVTLSLQISVARGAEFDKGSRGVDKLLLDQFFLGRATSEGLLLYTASAWARVFFHCPLFASMLPQCSKRSFPHYIVRRIRVLGPRSLVQWSYRKPGFLNWNLGSMKLGP